MQVINHTFCFITFYFLVNSAWGGTLEFTQTQFSVAENASSFDVTISRSGNVSATASVTVRSIADTATSGSDYVNMSQLVSWSAGESISKTVSVNLLDDNLVEGSEAFSLELTGFNGDTTGTNATSNIVITDFEEGSLSFAFATFSASEDSETSSVTIIRQSGFDGDVSVVLTATDGSALVDTDYEETEIVLEFEDGDTFVIAQIPLINDAVGEFDETITATLSSPTEGATLGTNSETVITVTDTDNDFTPALDLLSKGTDAITQPDYVDLTKPSFVDSSISLLDTINAITVLESTDLESSQNTNGLIEIPVGTETVYLSPLSATRLAHTGTTAIVLNDDQSGQFQTDQGIGIDFQPALQGLSVLQEALALLSMPDLEVNKQGNIVVQIDQGPPPLERNDQDLVVINNRYWDRFNLRPSGIGFLSQETTAGMRIIPHSSLPAESAVLVVFADGQNFRQQLLNPAPFNYPELMEILDNETSITNANYLGNGILEFNYNGATIRSFSDYIVRRSVDFESSNIGLASSEDKNGDGLADFNVIYSSGDEQYLFTLATD